LFSELVLRLLSGFALLSGDYDKNSNQIIFFHSRVYFFADYLFSNTVKSPTAMTASKNEALYSDKTSENRNSSLLGWGHTSAQSTSVATNVLYDGRC
jgi:hypothetical protein